MVLFKTKITEKDITYGPTDPDDLVAEVLAYELSIQGYRGISNAYCTVGRVDREDWLEVLARARHCSVSRFFMLDGSGVDPREEEYYIRAYTKDTLIIHPKIYQSMKKYFGVITPRKQNDSVY